MIAFKTFSDCGETPPSGVYSSWPFLEQEVSESMSIELQSCGYKVMTIEQYFIYRKSVSAQMAVEFKIQDAIDFGSMLLKQFSAENVLLGITQYGKTGEVLTKLSSVMSATIAGSLYEAIVRIKAIPPEDYDSIFVTDARLLKFVNQIESYLGITISAAL